MSTRACYVFADNTTGDAPHVVYKHHDGYPSGAIQWLEAAKGCAWPLPRFEADEFGASFIAANKSGAGGVRLVGCGDWKRLAPSDIEYLYMVTQTPKGVLVTGYAVSCNWGTSEWATPEHIFEEPLETIAAAQLGELA